GKDVRESPVKADGTEDILSYQGLSVVPLPLTFFRDPSRYVSTIYSTDTTEEILTFGLGYRLVAHLCWLRLDNKCPVDVGKRFETCRHYPRYRALRDAEVMCRRPLRAALTDDIQEDHQLQIIGPS
ncbi:unnamed protein product, partial [Fusarium fujikuroi]